MKVLSTEVEAKATTENADVSATPPESAESPDVFAQMIASAIAMMMVEPEKPEIKPDSQSVMPTKDTQDPLQQAAVLKEVVLGQLNSVSLSNEAKLVEPSAIKPQLLQPVDTKLTPLTLALSMPKTDKVDDEVIKELTQQMKHTMSPPPPSSSPSPSIMSTLLQPGEEQKGMTGVSTSEMSQQVLDSFKLQSDLNNATVSQQDQNKYTEAFAQLGHIINSHTLQAAQTLSESPHSINGLLSNNPQGDTAEAKVMMQPDYALRFEMLTPTVTLDALAKDTYNAKIKIYPPELGHVLASLKVGKNGTELTLTAETEHVKQIIEANISQLRQSFQQADIQLTNVNVQTPPPQPQGFKEQQHQNQRDAILEQEEQKRDKELGLEKQAPRGRKQSRDSLVDTYA